VIRYRFGPLDLGRVRLAVSPLYELQFSLDVLRDPDRQGAHLPWVRAARDALADVDLSLLDALVPVRGIVPDFIAPPPDRPLPDVAAELERVRRTPVAQVRRELRACFAGRRPPPIARRLLADPEGGLEEIVEALRSYWELALAPFWPRVRALAEAEIAARARALAERGPLGLFADLHPDLAWHDGVVQVDRPPDVDVELGGHGLLLVPSAFGTGLAFIVDRPWQPTILYPAAGVGALWEPVGAAPERALSALLGTRRAEVLVGLSRPATTGDLAHTLGASPAGVSEHLQILRRAGLVSPHRDGRFVRYRRTAAGEALVAAAVG
jgi:DNA-binding transcriptional ArsR family regulator